MSEREFETYLAMLSKLLRLSDEQRDAIADELRDHMEQRLDELARQGIGREEAVRMALEEFGDANALAFDLVRPRHSQIRKRIMRTSFGTVAATCAIAVAVLYLLPSRQPAVNGQQLTQPQIAAQPTGIGHGEQPVIELKSSVISVPRATYTAWTSQNKPTMEGIDTHLLNDQALDEFLAHEGVATIASPHLRFFDCEYAFLVVQYPDVQLIGKEQLVTIYEGLSIEVVGRVLPDKTRVGLSLDINTRWQLDLALENGLDTARPVLPGIGAWQPGITGVHMQVELPVNTYCIVPIPLSADVSSVGFDHGKPGDDNVLLLCLRTQIDES